MTSKTPLVSICVPTWNRAEKLRHLLERITEQGLELDEKPEICISNNGSTDNTGEIVSEYTGRYSGKLRYNENNKNLGFDMNLLKAIELATGKYVWLIGDDDGLEENALRDIIDSCTGFDPEKTGMIVLGRESYFRDNKTGDKTVYTSTLDKAKPETYPISRDEVIRGRVQDGSFMSVLILNGSAVKDVIREEEKSIEESIGIGYIHIPLYRIMFMKHKELKCVKINKPVIQQQINPGSCHFAVDDEFVLFTSNRRINQVLLSNKNSKDYKALLSDKRQQTKLDIVFVLNMMILKAFDTFNYKDAKNCIRLFMDYPSRLFGVVYSFAFLFFLIIPSEISKLLYKMFTRLKYGKERGERIYFSTATTYTLGSGGDQKRDFGIPQNS